MPSSFSCSIRPTCGIRFPAGIDRDQLPATYRDGLLSVRAPKAQRVSTVSVKVGG